MTIIGVLTACHKQWACSVCGAVAEAVRRAAEALARDWAQGKPASRADSCEPAEIAGHIARALSDQDLGHNCSGTSRGEITGHAKSTGE